MKDATASLDAALLGLDGFVVLATAEVGGELELLVETTAGLVGCPGRGAVARPKDRRPTWVRDLPLAGRPVVLCWWKRIWCCPHPLCATKTWTERHAAIAPRAVLTERARQWAFEQVGEHDAAVSRVADRLGVAWWTVMEQVISRGVPLVEDPARLDPAQADPAQTAPAPAPVTTLGVDETAFLRATGTHPTLFATGIADLSPGRARAAARRRRGTLGHRAGRLAGRARPGLARRGEHRIAGPVPRLRHRAGRPPARRRPRARPVPRRAPGPGLRR
jgi:hypothetical protein